MDVYLIEEIYPTHYKTLIWKETREAAEKESNWWRKRPSKSLRPLPVRWRKVTYEQMVQAFENQSKGKR